MTGPFKSKLILGTAVLIGSILLMVALYKFESPDFSGRWVCNTVWVSQESGKSVQCSMSEEVENIAGNLSVEGVLSIGAASWRIIKSGTGHGCSESFSGHWLSVGVEPINDAALLFEQERLDGKSLDGVMSDSERTFHSRIDSFTETQIDFVNGEGKKTRCTRR